MANAIGYNVKEANELMSSISTAYTDLGTKIKDEWVLVVKELQANWIGEDEQDYEKNLATRISNLYNSAYSLVDDCVHNIESVVNSWYTFQRNNVLLEEGESESKTEYTHPNIIVPTIKKNEKIISEIVVTFDISTDRGLTSENSGTLIQEKISTFVDNIKNSMTNILEKIDPAKAFFGGQKTALKGYIDEVGKSVSEVTVSIKDLHDALEKLAATNYSKSDELVNKEYSNTAIKDLQKNVNDNTDKSSRWDS